MVGRQDAVLRGLYHSDNRPKIPFGNVLVTQSENDEGKLSRLHQDLAALLVRSGFHLSKSPSSSTALEIILGDAKPSRSGDHLYASYSGWKAHVGLNAPEDVGADHGVNPVMSVFVAGLAVSEAFRRLLDGKSLFKPTSGWIGNLPVAESLPPPPSSLDFGGERVTWAGCGSVSFAALRALDCITKVNGSFDLVDPAHLNPSNCRKYLGISKGDRGKGKAEAMAHLLRGRGIDARVFAGSVNQFGRHAKFRLPLAVCVMDSSLARRDLQAKVPKTVLNAWTGSWEGSLFAGTTRHSFDGVEECLNCAYWEDVEGKANLVDLAMNTGTDSVRLYRLLREGDSLPSAGRSSSLGEERFLDGFANACDAAKVPVGSIRREYSVPFVAAIGGALLALSMMLEGSEEHAKYRLHSKRLRFAMGPRDSSIYTEPMAAREKCICHDPAYRQVYADMWET